MRVLIMVIGMLCFSNTFCQTIVFVDQNKILINRNLEILISFTGKQIDVNIYNSNHHLYFENGTNEFISLTVEGAGIQTYFNQFTIDQFNSIDTIILYTNDRKGAFFPLIDLTEINDSTLAQHSWFKDYLKGIDVDKSCFELKVYSTYPLDKKIKKEIQSKIVKLYDFYNLPRKNIKLIFLNTPYVCTSEDFFASGTLITKEFIDKQNTDFMKGKAKEYSLVGRIFVK